VNDETSSYQKLPKAYVLHNRDSVNTHNFSQSNEEKAFTT